jgi:uncharacterized membrane protein YphA (DoxX/SURF4 family)
MKIRHLPMRLATGAVILNSGLSKRNAPPEVAERVHGFATSAYPPLTRSRPEQFVRLLSVAEITLGAALLIPVVPTTVAAAGLTAFSAGLIGLYLRGPGLREEGSLRPTQQGNAIVKDVWMLGIGVGMLIDEMTDH